jgi:hypothetical protein
MVAKSIINIVLLILALILFLGVWNAWGPVPLLISTLIALVALKLIGWLGIRIEINIWSILIVLIGNIPGLLILIFLSITGIAFRPRKSR